MTSQLEEPQLEEPQEQEQGWLGSIARSSWPWWWLAGLVSLGSCSAVSLWPLGGVSLGLKPAGLGVAFRPSERKLPGASGMRGASLSSLDTTTSLLPRGVSIRSRIGAVVLTWWIVLTVFVALPLLFVVSAVRQVEQHQRGVAFRFGRVLPAIRNPCRPARQQMLTLKLGVPRLARDVEPRVHPL